ncbi:MAG: hypothetical protein VX527_01815 [Planctomycetota bacterium]|nr:hypothetical protein [Planctomycetota bacterium]
MPAPEDTSTKIRGLAPSATPSVVYGVLAVALSAVPIVGFVLGWLAYFRSQQAAIQLEQDDRLEGHGLRRVGATLGLAAMLLGTASTVVWLVILVASVPWA